MPRPPNPENQQNCKHYNQLFHKLYCYNHKAGYVGAEWDDSQQKFRCKICKGEWMARYSLPGHSKSERHRRLEDLHATGDLPQVMPLKRRRLDEYKDEPLYLHQVLSRQAPTVSRPKNDAANREYDDGWAAAAAEQMMGDELPTAGTAFEDSCWTSLQDAINSHFVPRIDEDFVPEGPPIHDDEDDLFRTALEEAAGMNEAQGSIALLMSSSAEAALKGDIFGIAPDANNHWAPYRTKQVRALHSYTPCRCLRLHRKLIQTLSSIHPEPYSPNHKRRLSYPGPACVECLRCQRFIG
jgi:hypothetical protein